MSIKPKDDATALNRNYASCEKVDSTFDRKKDSPSPGDVDLKELGFNVMPKCSLNLPHVILEQDDEGTPQFRQKTTP